MLVNNTLSLAVTFMQVLATVLRDPAAIRTYAPDGSSVSISSLALPGHTLVLEGTDFEAGTDTGVVQSFKVIPLSGPGLIDGLFPVQMLLTQMVLTALAGAGKVTPSNYDAFYKLLMPNAFLQLFYTGHAGQDFAEGFDGNDILSLLEGNDFAYLSKGNDDIDGGAGNRDRVSGAFLENGIKVNLPAGVINEKNTANVTTVHGIEDVTGTRSADDMLGNNRGNRFDGGAGNDILDGRGGNDVLNGGSGRDILKGGDGNDVLKGGPGSDRFVFGPDGGDDRITDYEAGLDRLDIRALDFGSLDDVKAATVEQNGGVLITGGGTTIFIGNITEAALFSGDVLF